MDNNKHCVTCEHYRMNRKLEYYNFPYCDLNDREISFNDRNGWDRMRWCPLKEDPNDRQKQSDC